MKRRLRDASLPEHLSLHSFRMATVTGLLTQQVPLEDVQYLAGHSDQMALRPAPPARSTDRRRCGRK